MLTFQIFAAPAIFSAWKIAPPFVPPRLPLPPTTTCSLPDYLLPPTTACSLPRLPATSHNYLPPSTTTCCPRCACLEKDLRPLALDCVYGGRPHKRHNECTRAW